ncbi:hypothetical protein T07_915 [Trichinella nelsoni]|uniref:Uncharacterized protein n=1 Tax=Trichinella nelsoni TaxID=6336 RepID=A0A0V0RUH7_9BILA|nr:hypothetical protein T07_915 [Trichinella nelsoni]
MEWKWSTGLVQKGPTFQRVLLLVVDRATLLVRQFSSSLAYHSRKFLQFGKIQALFLDAHENGITSAKRFRLCKKTDID